jgi:L-ectoine synthase
LRAVAGDLRLICVFNPPLAGNEKHQADGSYAAAAD